ncbi:MAG: SH3 domain-containing protein [Chloroflexi bacterium]|nr:SH3 domain-containing protein [Chloroflexota bacterium]
MKKIQTILGLLLVSTLLMALFPIANTSRAQDPIQARVIPQLLNVRDVPGPNSNVIGQLSGGTVVNVQGREDQADNGGLWVYVTPTTGGLTGWVLIDYLEFQPGVNLDTVPLTNATGTGSTAPSNPTTPSDPAPVAPTGAATGTTIGQVNFRGGPGTTYPVLRQLSRGLAFAPNGRSTDGQWYRAVIDGQEGWLFYQLVRVTGDVNGLPVIEVAPPITTNGSTTTTNAPAAPSSIVSNIGTRARQIYVRGQQLGNRPDVFSKVGDSISASPLFLNPVGSGGLRLDTYGYLQPVVDFFSKTGARTGNSFNNESLAARGGWTTYDVLNPELAVPGVCQIGETPLVCEYRVVKPSVALIMFGSNDTAWVDSGSYRANLQTIVQTSIDMGVIPVLSTIPDQLGTGVNRVAEFNNIIRSVARANNIPVWDYWQSLQSLPNYGMSGDGLHPSFDPTQETGIFTADGLRYGYNMRNLTALIVLDAIWRKALY